MAVHWESEGSASAVDTLKRRIFLACLAGALVILVVNLLTGWLVKTESHKVSANQIVSPLDKSQIPPVLHASRVVLKVQSPKPTVAQDTEKPARHHHVRHRWTTRHHTRRDPGTTTTGAEADYSKGYL